MSMIFLKCYKPKGCSLLNWQYITCAKYPLIVRWARSNRHDPFSPNVFGNTWNRDAPAVTATRPAECQPLEAETRTRIAPKPMDLMICALVCRAYMSRSSNIVVVVLNHHSNASQANDDWTFWYTLNFDWMPDHILDDGKEEICLQMQQTIRLFYFINEII